MCSIVFITNLVGEIRRVKVTVLLANAGCVGMDGFRIINVSLQTNRKHQIFRR
jgi:hypothetical protein